jgi:hypothetical protein
MVSSKERKESPKGLRNFEEPYQKWFEPEHPLQVGWCVSSELLEPDRLDSIVEDCPINLRVFEHHLDIYNPL